MINLTIWIPGEKPGDEWQDVNIAGLTCSTEDAIKAAKLLYPAWRSIDFALFKDPQEANK